MRFLALLGSVLALAGPAGDPGASGNRIVIGGSGPLSGAGAQVAKGAQAYFDHVNALGGVHGRTIEFRYLDGGGDAAVTLAAAQQFVREGTFALFATAGTVESLAIRSYLARLRVPQLFVASGASAWGRDAARYPGTIGYAPTHRLEAEAIARHILRTRPRARIGVLYALGPDGSELLASFRGALGTRAGLIVQAVPHDLSVGRLDDLRAAGADTLVNLAGESQRPSWRAQVYATSLAVGTPAPGTIAPVFVKEPTDPRWARDAGLAPYRPLAGGAYVRGLAAAFTLVDALRKAGPELTRARLVEAVRSLNEAANPFLLPGIVVRTGPGDPYPVEQIALQRYQHGRWSGFTGLLTVTG